MGLGLPLSRLRGKGGEGVRKCLSASRHLPLGRTGQHV